MLVKHSCGWIRWKRTCLILEIISEAQKLIKVFTAPGNGGTKNNISIEVNELDELAEFAKKNNCFTVVGPETPLADGIVDTFNQKNLRIFGPTKKSCTIRIQ